MSNETTGWKPVCHDSRHGCLPCVDGMNGRFTRSQPDAPKADVQLSLALWKQNRNEAARDEMRRASQLTPKDADIRSDLGLALGWLGRIPEAIDQLHEALRLNPNSAEAHNNLGLALLASGKPRESQIPECRQRSVSSRS